MKTAAAQTKTKTGLPAPLPPRDTRFVTIEGVPHFGIRGLFYVDLLPRAGQQLSRLHHWRSIIGDCAAESWDRYARQIDTPRRVDLDRVDKTAAQDYARTWRLWGTPE